MSVSFWEKLRLSKGINVGIAVDLLKLFVYLSAIAWRTIRSLLLESSYANETCFDVR